ncbi:MAG: T9SS type A sorting domain-containing protein [Ignavibacteria bacterium]
MKKSTILILISIIAFFDCLPQAWIQQSSGTSESINAVCFSNVNTGFAAGSGGIIRKTTNGGINWFSVPCPFTNTFDYIRLFGPDSIVIASRNNDTLLFSVNSGANWIMREIPSQYTSATKDVNFINFNTGFYYKAGTLFKTTDAGQTWAQSSVGIAVRRMSFVDENTGWICGVYTIPYPPPYGTNYSEVRVTYNAGINWTVLLSVQEQSYSIYRIFMKNTSQGFFNDASSYSISRTQNGGVSWNSTSGAGMYQMYFEMCFPSVNTGYFIGNKTIKSTNGGLNWTEISTPHPAQMYEGIFFINDNTGWITGNGGIIIKTVTGGVTGINSGNPVISDYALYQNYPNPFNPVTTIKFDISELTNVVVKIYDIRGKEIATIIDEMKSPGSYSVNFDAGRFSSGVYFYKIQTGSGFSSIRKMVLCK